MPSKEGFGKSTAVGFEFLGLTWAWHVAWGGGGIREWWGRNGGRAGL